MGKFIYIIDDMVDFTRLTISSSQFMKRSSMKNLLTLLVLIACSFFSLQCQNKEKKLIPLKTSPEIIKQKQFDQSDSIQTVIKIDAKKTTNKIKVLVIQCSNGYGYSGGGYDFNPIIEKELRKNLKFEMLPFSYKKLQGVIYQGVYDKKYAKPIMEKIKADIYIMTSFEGGMLEMPGDDEQKKWGYEVKILNGKTLQQKVSIGAKGLNSYEEIEKDIISKVNILTRDIKSLI